MWPEGKIYLGGVFSIKDSDGKQYLSEEAQMIYDKYIRLKYGKRKIIKNDLNWEI